ncbi:hypothetical protein CWI37_0218p0020 [Hamiltosporidium tvaerminnensis]|uniref:Uncharacterized protein n=1 Tax=Hamiltosporidium tvaerminnensis TaxID=1176355 RepID=A0A4Q9L9D2_9MICR|nr:hypothetical protein LUQ84_000405 [Hamiltosporidium tvaerminnensis]TBU03875.1 hypothetical protein CWI37_0218p0020 [Hamiltosporidium tvaerminnensis]
MLRRQLECIKQKRKTSEIRSKPFITFKDVTDMDDETLLEQIPIETEFTTYKSLGYNRQHNTLEEENFICQKLSQFIKSLHHKMNIENIEYLFDFLIRKYCIDTFNSRDLVFLLLPYQKYYDKVVKLSEKFHTIDSFIHQNTYSLIFFGHECLRNIDFFDFFITYFEFYDVLKNFIDGVYFEILKSNICIKNYHALRLFESLKFFASYGEIEISKEIFKKFSKELLPFKCKIEIIFSNWENKFNKIADEEEKTNFATKNGLNNIKNNFGKTEEFDDSKSQNIFNENEISEKEIKGLKNEESIEFELYLVNKKDREFVYNLKKLIKYFEWIYEHENYGIEDTSYNNDEYNFCLYLFSKKNIYSELKISDLRNIEDLFTHMKDKIFVIRKLLTKFSYKNLEFLIKYLKKDELIVFVSMCDDANEIINLMTNENHEDILKKMRRTIFVKNLVSVFKKSLEFKNFSIIYFEDYITNLCIKECLDFSRNDIFSYNLLNLCKEKKISIVHEILELDFINELFLEYVLYNEEDLSLDSKKRIFEIYKNRSHNKKLQTAFNFFILKETNIEFLNQILNWFIDMEFEITSIIEILRKNLYLINSNTLLKLLKINKFRKDILFVTEKLIHENSENILLLLETKNIKIAKEIISKMNLINFLESLSITFFFKNFDFIKDLIIEKSRKEDTLFFLKKSFEIYKNKELVIYKENISNIFLNEKYLNKNLIYFIETENWEFIKPLVLQGIKIHKEIVDLHFDYLIFEYGIINTETYYLLLILNNLIEPKNLELNVLHKILEKNDINCLLTAHFIFLLGLKHNLDILSILNKIIDKIVFIEENDKIVFWLINRYRNVLAPHLQLFISLVYKDTEFHEYLILLNYKIVIREIVRMKELSNDTDFISLFTKYLKNITIDDHKTVISMIDFLKNRNEPFCCDLNTYFLISVSEIVNEETKLIIQKFVQEMYEYDVYHFYGIMDHVIVNDKCFWYFDPFFEESLESLKNNQLYVTNALSNYLKYAKSIALEYNEILNILSVYFDRNYDECVINCIVSILNHARNTTISLDFNLSILKKLKSTQNLKYIKILGFLYKNVINYNECINQSIPYFSIIINRGSDEIKSKMDELFVVIENLTGKTIYSLF